MAEFVFLALRTAEGMLKNSFATQFEVEFTAIYGKVAEILAEKGLLNNEPDRISLTEQGMKFGNQVFEQFLPE